MATQHASVWAPYVVSSFVFLTACTSRPEEKGVGTLAGQVMALDGTPVANANVQAGGVDTTTDERGFFELARVPASGSLDVVASGPGYSTGHDRIALAHAERALLELTLLPMKTVELPDIAQGGAVSGDDGFSIALEPLSLIDAQGLRARGPVSVSYALIDTPGEMMGAPGGMLADIDGTPTPLQSFGMVEVKFAQEGAPLELDRGRATISFGAHGEHAHGDRIGLYHFDEALGVWKSKGRGTVVGDAFQAEVDHFSWWNADEPLTETACLRGRVETPDGRPAVSVLVQAVGTTLLTRATSLTDTNGEFMVRVPVGSENVLSAFWMEEVNGQSVAYRWSQQMPFAGAGPCHDMGAVRVGERAATCVQGSVQGFGGDRPATWWVQGEDALTSGFGFAELSGGGEFCFDVPAGARIAVGGGVTCAPAEVPLFNNRASCATGGCQPFPLDCRTTGPNPERCECGTRLPNGTCVLEAELCDGADNDCDGRVDEGLTEVTTCGFGACLRAGSRFCLGGSMAHDCEPANDDTPEDCNDRDDDCDGEIDEELPSRTGPACGEGACRATSAESCTNGAWTQNECVPLPPAQSESCNALDDDCNGVIDEGLNRQVSCGLGACNVTLDQACTNGSWVGARCPVPGDFDECDGVDIDCDGTVDEDQCCGGPDQDVALTPRTNEPPTVLILQDGSGSIVPAWTRVREALIAATTPLQGEVRFGLSVFPAQRQPDLCAPGTIVVPPALGNGPAITNYLRSLTTVVGNTPTVQTLAMAREYLAGVQGPRRVILVTDGLPNCAGAPPSQVPGLSDSAYQASLLAAAGIPVYTVAWGAGISNDSVELNAVAAAGGTGSAVFVTNAEQLRSVVQEISSAAVPCRFQLLAPVSPGQISVSLNGELLPELADPESAQRGWALVDDGQTILLRGSACDARASGGVLHVANSCGVCGERGCEADVCHAEPTRETGSSSVQHPSCPVASRRVVAGEWVGTYRNTKLASGAEGRFYVLGEFTADVAAGVDDSALGSPCFVEGFDAAGDSMFRRLLSAEWCTIGGITVDRNGDVIAVANDGRTGRGMFYRLQPLTGADRTRPATIPGIGRVSGLGAVRRALDGQDGVAVFGTTQPAGASAFSVASVSQFVARARSRGIGAFARINDVAASDTRVCAVGAPSGDVAGYARGRIECFDYAPLGVGAPPTQLPESSFAIDFPAELRAVAMDASGLYVAGNLDRSTNFGCTRLVHAGMNDMFVARIGRATGEIMWIRQIGGPETERVGSRSMGGGLTTDSTGQVTLLGRYEGSAQFAGLRFGAGGASRGVFTVRLDRVTGAVLSASELDAHGESGTSVAGTTGQGLVASFYGGALQTSSYATCSP